MDGWIDGYTPKAPLRYSSGCERAAAHARCKSGGAPGARVGNGAAGDLLTMRIVFTTVPLFKGHNNTKYDYLI